MALNVSLPVCMYASLFKCWLLWFYFSFFTLPLPSCCCSFVWNVFRSLDMWLTEHVLCTNAMNPENLCFTINQHKMKWNYFCVVAFLLRFCLLLILLLRCALFIFPLEIKLFIGFHQKFIATAQPTKKKQHLIPKAVIIGMNSNKPNRLEEKFWMLLCDECAFN